MKAFRFTSYFILAFIMFYAMAVGTLLLADGFGFTPGSGATLASDLISSLHYQRVKIALGADGAYDMDLDSGQQTKANSMPVTMASDQGSDASYPTVNSIAFGSVTGSYTTLLSDTNAKKWVKINNELDAGVYLSFNASTNHTYLAPGEIFFIDYNANNRYEDSNISVKYVSAPTSGSIIVSAGY